MNRPNKENYKIITNIVRNEEEINFKEYANDLEKYCDEQEAEREKLEKRLMDYDRALKKAIEMVVFEKPVNMTVDPLVTAVQLREELLGDE